MNDDPFTITVECVGNPRCIFSGEDIPVRITLKNSSKEPVGFAVDYLESKGPYVQLVDRQSAENCWLQINNPPRELAQKYDNIEPQHSIQLNTLITAEEIRTFRRDLIDLQVNVAMRTNLKPERGAPFYYDGRISFSIVGKDTEEARGFSPSR